MPTNAQGLFKKTTYKKQVAQGTVATGAGGKILRRVTSVFTAARQTTANNEIVSHLQDTGVTYGQKEASGKINGAASPGTYSELVAGIIRAAFAAVAPFTAADVTAQATGPQFATAAGDFLAAGLKQFDVVRWTGFTTTGAANNAKNFWITTLTATAMTGVFLDGDAVAAKASGDSASCTVVGKKTKAPMVGHNNDWFTFEEWYGDISKSEVFPDCKVNQIQYALPAQGQGTNNFDIVGIGTRTRGVTQSFTSPTAETTTQPVQALHGKIFVNGVEVTNTTSLSLTLDSGISPSGASIGSAVSSDLNQGRLKVSGSFVAGFNSTAVQDLFDAESNVAVAAVITTDNSAMADFMAFTMTRVKITSDTPDDGEKTVMRTYAFTAELNGAGGAALAQDQTIISVQDSAA